MFGTRLLLVIKERIGCSLWHEDVGNANTRYEVLRKPDHRSPGILFLVFCSRLISVLKAIPKRIGLLVNLFN